MGKWKLSVSTSCMSHWIGACLSIVVSTSLISCSNKTKSVEPTVSSEPPVERSVQSVKRGSEYYVRLSVPDLGQTYLLQAGLITQELIPMFNGGRSRLVRFVDQGDRVYMMESSDGNVVTKSLDQSLLLASFPIVDRKADALLIDWSSGMSRIFMASDWTGQDFDGPEFKSGYQTVKVTNSLIESPIQYEKNTAVFTQTAQAEIFNVFSGDTQVALKVRYFLKPYVKSPTFQPTVSKDFKTHGFFEVAPKVKESGFTASYASKFDISKGPIKYAVSADTPEAYKQAVRDGILYWNSIIPGIVEAVDAPAGIQAPDLNYNMVQWVNWDAAGFAYADAMMDPLNGEIKHAQVYMTSVFAVGGRARAIKVLRKLRAFEGKKHQVIGLKGLTGETLCQSDYSSRFADSLEKALKLGVDDATILRISGDYVREVVAHEIGHTLGLRHNFAGNLGTSYKYADRAAIFREYVENDKISDAIVPSSSVMEYNEFEEGVLLGALMRTGARPMSYDKSAIQKLYQNQEPVNPVDVAPFCTDSGADVYLDCTRFDSGRTLFEAAQTQSQELIDDLTGSIIETFLRQAKESIDPEMAMPVQGVKLDAAAFVSVYNKDRAKVLGALGVGMLWEVRRTFPVIDDVNSVDVAAAERDFAHKVIKSLGGIGAVYRQLPLGWEAEQVQLLKNKLAMPKYTSGVNVAGQAWTLTGDEIAWIQSRGEKMIAKVGEKIRETDLMALNAILGLPETDYQANIATFLSDWQVEYVFSLDPNLVTTMVVKDKDGKDVNVKLPKFTYPENLRKLAATLLSLTRFKSEDAVVELKKANKERFTQLIEASVGKRDQYTTEKLPAEVRKWIAVQTAIESAL